MSNALGVSSEILRQVLSKFDWKQGGHKGLRITAGELLFPIIKAEAIP